MRRADLAGLVLLAFAGLLAAAPARAVNASLTWTTCDGPTARTIDCTRNTGVDELVVSLVPSGISSEPIVGLEFFVGLRFCTSTTLPPWWQFKNAGSCRQNALTILATTSDGNCPALFDTPTLVTWSYNQGVFSTLDAYEQRLSAVVTNDGANSIVSDPATSYDVAHLRIAHTSTTGAGACAGCSQPVWLYLLYGKATYGDGHYEFMNLPTGIVTASANDGACTRTVPVRNATWGRIKSQYR